MKNKILILSALILLSGCNGTYHLKKSLKHKEKALKKGVTIPKDTVTIRTTDTITQTFTKNDTTYIVKTVTNTVELEPVIEYKTRWQTKHETKYKYKTIKTENKTVIDSLKQVVRTERQKTKQTRAENRNRWWLWLLIGFALGYILKIIINLRGVKQILNRNYE